MTILTIRKHKRFAVRRKANLVCSGNRPKPGLLVELSLEGCRMGITGSADFAVSEPKCAGQATGSSACVLSRRCTTPSSTS
jgi:hypothetical protein